MRRGGKSEFYQFLLMVLFGIATLVSSMNCLAQMEIILKFGNYSRIYENFSLTNKAIEEPNSMGDNLEYLMAVKQNSFLAGSIIGMIFIGDISHYFGHRRALGLTAFFAIIGNGMMTSSNTFWTFTLSNILAGVSVDAMFTTMYVIAVKYIEAKWRTKAQEIVIIASHTFGMAMTTYLTTLMVDWRLFLLVATLPTVIVLIYPFIICESAQHRFAENEQELSKACFKEVLRNIAMILSILSTLFILTHFKLCSLSLTFYLPISLLFMCLKNRIGLRKAFCLAFIITAPNAYLFEQYGMSESYFILLNKLMGYCRYAVIVSCARETQQSTAYVDCTKFAQTIVTAYFLSYILRILCALMAYGGLIVSSILIICAIGCYMLPDIFLKKLFKFLTELKLFGVKAPTEKEVTKEIELLILD